MLGAIKGDVSSGGSLFRLLSRRWRPLARVRRKPVSFSAALGAEDEGAPARAWIGVKRQRMPAAPAVTAKRTNAAWSPWLWMK